MQDVTFLLCSERSGGNLITRMFDAHPDYCGPSPTHLFNILATHLGRYGDVREDANWAALTNDAADLFATKTGVWRTTPSRVQLRKLAPRTLATLLAHIYSTEAAAHGKRHIFAKENHTYRIAPLLLSWFPAAKFVFLVRDPRDMALSWKESPVHRGGVGRAARIWVEDQTESLRFLHGLNDPERVVTARYEDIVAKPSDEARRICHALGADYAPSMLGFFDDELTRQNAACTDNWKNLRKPIMGDNFGKFRSALSEDELALVECLCAPLMEHFGYARESRQNTGDLPALEARVSVLTPAEKSTFAAVPEAEKERRAARIAVLDRIRCR